MTLDRQLLEIVRCPACRGTFAEQAGREEITELTCTQCGAAYPVRNGVPVLLVDEARRPGEPSAASSDG
jgi:uncharacterized protein YbaR (Trm112 family)